MQKEQQHDHPSRYPIQQGNPMNLCIRTRQQPVNQAKHISRIGQQMKPSPKGSAMPKNDGQQAMPIFFVPQEKENAPRARKTQQ